MPKDASPEGDLLVHVRGAISEYERQKIRERTLRGKREKARRGLIVAGPAAYGYRRDPAQPGKLVVHAEEAAVVRQAYTWLADQQWSTRAIALELTRWGILPPKSRAWALSSVARMLRDPIYVGRAYYNRRQWSGTSYKARPAGEWFEIPVPPIVNPLVYQKVQAQLARNRHRYQGRRASGSTCSRAW